MTPAELLAARKALGLTQPQLGQALGVHTMTVWAWEHARQAIPPYLRLAIQHLACPAR